MMRRRVAGALQGAFIILTIIQAFASNSVAQPAPDAAEQSEMIADIEAELQSVNMKTFNNEPDALQLAIKVEERARSLPVSVKRTELIVRSIRYRASALVNSGDQKEALNQLSRAEELQLPEDSPSRGGLYYARARIFETLGDFGKAIEYYGLAHEVYIAANKPESQAIALGQIANVYLRADQYDQVLLYASRSLDLKSKRSASNMANLTNLGIALVGLDRLEQARGEFIKALEISREGKFPSHECYILAKLALLEIQRGDNEAAYLRIEEALVLSRSENMGDALNDVLVARAELELLAGDLDAAKSTIETMFTNVDLLQTANIWLHRHEAGYKVYEALGEIDLAFAHHKAFKRLDDEAKNLAADANNAILSAEFEFSQKELEIERLHANQLESDAALVSAGRQQARIIGAAVSTAVLSALSFLGWAYFSARKTARITRTLNSELSAKNKELLSSNANLEKANHAKMEFLATTSHEVRTPLNAIIGLTDVILRAEHFYDKHRDYLEVINTSGKNLLQILDDILDVSRLEAGRMQVNLRPLNIAGCLLDVAELWRNAAEEKGLSYKIDIEQDIGSYLCDEKLLRQMLSNLLSNAIKFTHEGGIALSLYKSTEKGLTFVVRDTGVGIDPENKKQIFDAFHQADSRSQRSFGGTGLGLAICKNIAAELGGEITVRSRAGKGSTFLVALPLEKSDKATDAVSGNVDAAPKASEHDNELSVLRILIAEDNTANALVMCAMLEGQVADIEVVLNGEEAVRIIQERPFDAILMDKQMPVMDGIAATNAIRALPRPYCDMPIIGVTADLFSGVRTQCIESGMDAFVAKPVHADKLKTAIINATKARRTKAA